MLSTIFQIHRTLNDYFHEIIYLIIQMLIIIKMNQHKKLIHKVPTSSHTNIYLYVHVQDTLLY